MTPETALRAAAAGASTGGRTFTALAGLTLTTPERLSGQPGRTLQRTWAKVTTSVLAVAELAGDKLPQTPSRLQPQGFVGRIVVGAGVGAIVADRADAGLAPELDAAATNAESAADTARRRQREMVVGASISLTAAVAATWLGQRWRSVCASWVGHDLPGALLEDAAVAGLAAVAARPARLPR